MPRFLPATLAIPLTLMAANAVAECAAPAATDSLIVLNEGVGRAQAVADLPGGVGERVSGEIKRSYARAGSGGYVAPGIDGLQTFYPRDPSDDTFGPNPISQMPVVDIKASYERCFTLAPATSRLEDIEAANRAASVGLSMADPRMAWSAGIGGGWWTIQTIHLRSETGEWRGAQLTHNAMWSPATVGLPMPPDFGPREYKAFDVAAWNSDQVPALPTGHEH
jgi:hypothetical protein